MRFYLVKDGVVNSGNWAHPENQQATCLLSHTFTSLVPMMSERQNGNGFWNMKTVDKCATLLMNELMKSSNDIRLNAVISLSCATKGGKLLFSVAIEKCGMLREISSICGDKAKLILEIYFDGYCMTRSCAGLVTPEMSITSQKNKVSCKASDILATDAMEIYRRNYIAYGWMHAFWKCNIVLIVSDDLPLFQTISSSDTTRRILEEAIHSDFEIVASDGAVVKCHRSFLSVHSPVLERMLESLTESSSSRMTIKDMDKSVVVAFLQYLYCKDLPANDLSLSLKLLQAAHKYEIGQLEHATLELLVQKQDVYFTAEFAWAVFVFVRNIPNGTDLKEKVMNIIDSEKAVLDQTFRQLMRDTSDGSATDELTQWIIQKNGEMDEGIDADGSVMNVDL